MPDQAVRDKQFMMRAIQLAQTQKGRTHPNPAVGCILVRDGRVIGEGVTADGGRPHAETQALHDARERVPSGAFGATAYVTLEPCSHYGQTAPCARALIEAGIVRCVIACVDPDSRVHWRGVAMLQEAGIDTVVGVETEAAREVMADFLSAAVKKS